MKNVRFERSHLLGIVNLCQQEGWPTFPSDHQRALRAVTAPGVITMVALDNAQVIGFAQLQTDGAVQAHLSLIAVSREHRRRGIGRKLIETAFALSGAQRIDLVTDTAVIRKFTWITAKERTWNGSRGIPARTQ